MSESMITKKALAASLKQLMKTRDFAHISVLEISQNCGLTRKSFYYHFKDKYDLVNWIFDTSFVEQVEGREYISMLEFLDELTRYLYSDKEFYRGVLQIQGQNSFQETFYQAVRPIANRLVNQVFENSPNQEYFSYFFCEGILATISSWILCEEAIPPDEFIGETHFIIDKLAQNVLKEENKGDKI